MIRTKILAVLLLVSLYSCNGQSNTTADAVIAFYNVENLFDTEDDPDTWDDDFTPKGSYRYNEKIYKQKLHNIATVIKDINPDVLGLAEIENETVLKDLIAQPDLKGYQYKYAWYNSPDPRGIDVALLYKAASLKVEKAQNYAVKLEGLKTRDVLFVTGALHGETVHFLVNHWPSRREGVRKSEPKRIAAAKVNKRIADSLLRKDARAKIFIMGDMNDNPTDKSVADGLEASSTRKDKKGYLYNPWADIHRSGQGTSVYHKQWDHFDQLIISGAAVEGKGLHLKEADIFDETYIRNPDYGADGYPYRSFNGKRWNNGYSDHFPVVLYLQQ